MDVVDIPGSIMNADIHEEVIMVMEGTMDEMLVKTSPRVYRKHILTKKDGKPIL